MSAPKYLYAFVTMLVFFVTPSSAQEFPYRREQMPFNAPAVARAIDNDCSDIGTANSATQQAQNRAKNNFGARGDAVPVRITDFDRLQRATEQARNCAANGGNNCRPLTIGSGGLPSDRNQLEDIITSANGDTIGEGTIVVLEAKVLDSHYSNTKYNVYGRNRNGTVQRGSGESVNCKRGQESAEIDRNDIHIVLAAPGVDRECLSVTAEISPHFRPASWRRFHNMSAESNTIDINREARGVDFSRFQMVRITGTLFYDASHEPCSPGRRASPARRSSWEIHPVYKLEVKVNGQWRSFDDWARNN